MMGGGSAYVHMCIHSYTHEVWWHIPPENSDYFWGKLKRATDGKEEGVVLQKLKKAYPPTVDYKKSYSQSMV